MSAAATGALALEVARWAEHVVGVDPDARAPATARKARPAARADRTRFPARRASSAVPLEDGAFDVALLAQALHRVAATRALLVREAARITRAGGRVLVLDLLPHREAWVRERLGPPRSGFAPGDVKAWLGERASSTSASRRRRAAAATRSPSWSPRAGVRSEGGADVSNPAVELLKRRRSPSASSSSTARWARRSRPRTSRPRTSAGPRSRAATRTSSSRGRTSCATVHERYLAAGATSSRPTRSAPRRSCSPSTASPTRRARSTARPPRIAREACARSRRRPPALGRGLDGPDDEGDHGHGRRHVRGAGRALPRPGARARRGRRRLPAARDLPGHAQRQGGAARDRARLRATSAARIPVAVSRHDRADGHDARGPGRRGALRARSCTRDLLYLGLNCATGPEFMTDHVRRLAAIARTRVACVPERGPARRGRLLPRDARRSSRGARALRATQGWLNLVGGCCGTTRRAHRARSREAVARHARRARSRPRRRTLALRRRLPRGRPTTCGRVIVGERTNVLGSRKFKGLDRRGEVGRGGARSRARR